jgi:predicted alpha/beta-fold hydrolase
LLSSGHAQTLAGLYLPSHAPPETAEQHWIELADGDHIVLHDDCPAGWSESDRVALLLHGLAGCHASGYMRRVAIKLGARGVRSFRMDMRGLGAALGKARQPAHAGRIEDALAALERITALCPRSSLTLVGFSMGGNIALGALASARHSVGILKRGIAVSPPADLAACCRALREGVSRLYDRYLAQFLVRTWTAMGRELNGAVPRSIYEFDQQITAPISGFRNAEDYYEQASCGPRIREIELPTIVLAARDDPMVPVETITQFALSPSVTLYLTHGGGHLGYITSRRHVADGRWLDQQVVHWVCQDQWQ